MSSSASDLLTLAANQIDAVSATLRQASAALEPPAPPATPVKPIPPPAPIPAPPVTSSIPSDITVLKRPGGNVYEYGDLFTYPAPNNWAPHADYVVNGQTIKNHYWGSRWYDGKFVVKNKIADLVAAKLIPPHHGATNLTIHAFQGMYDQLGIPIPLIHNAPFDYELPAYMGQAGDNFGIGPFPEQCAAYIATENAALAASVEAYARSGMTMPIHVRDPKTGKPVDYRTYPGFSTYSGQTNSMIAPNLKTGIIGDTPDPNGLHWDTAHSPNFFFLAYMLTEDPVWLEELQLVVSFEWSKDYPNYTLNHLDNLQTRELAWGMRDLINVVVATQHAESLGVLPDFLLSSEYFRQIMLLPTITWLSAFFTDTSPAGFAKLDAPGVYAPWQFDFLTINVGVGVWQGLEELRPAFNWLAAGLVERLTGRRGWNTDYPTFYYLAKPTPDWASAFAEVMAEDQSIVATSPPAGTFPTALLNTYQDYVGWASAAARVGAMIGHSDLMTIYPPFEAKVKASGIGRNYRHAVGA